MHKMQLVMWAALAIAVATPVYFLQRTRDVFSGLNQLVAERHFTAQPSSPVAAFTGKDPPVGLHFYQAYAGELRQKVPVTLVLLRRTESVLIKGVPVQTSTIYVGAYLPPVVKLDDGWVKTWEDRVARKQGNVAYAARAAEGGVVIVWQGAPSRRNVEEHLAALSGSLPGS